MDKEKILKILEEIYCLADAFYDLQNDEYGTDADTSLYEDERKDELWEKYKLVKQFIESVKE